MYMSACIVAAQLVMIPVAILTGKLADPWGRKPLFLIGFTVLALRGILYTLGKGAVYLIAVQSLDGVGAAIFGVLWVIIISDLAKGTGRFNLLQGAIQAALGVGAFLSNFLAGFVVKSLGHNAGFLGLAGIASIGLVFFALFMPETKDQSTRETGNAFAHRCAGTRLEFFGFIRPFHPPPSCRIPAASRKGNGGGYRESRRPLIYSLRQASLHVPP